MKFKINICKEIKHTGVLCCLDWSKNDEIYTIGDDQQLFKWDTKTRSETQVAKLPEDFYPNDLQWLCGNRSSNKSTGNSSGNKANDSLLICSNDGRFIMLNRSARAERIVNAHVGSINVVRWSPDGTGLLTAGEDGTIKVFSKLGMLRSTIIQNETPVRIACWSANSMSIAYCTGSFIAIKPLAANSKLIKWKAHSGSVLCMSWSNETQNIASGGDDCQYKIWDNQGSLIYASFVEDYSITSVEFGPKGLYLAVGGFNMLRLCHYTGWAYSNMKFSSPPIGSVYSIRWSKDGSQIAAGSGTGALLFAHIIEEEKASRNLKAKTISRKEIELQDIVTRTIDTLDFPDRIIKWEIGYGYLVVATTNQVHIYNEKYTNTPLSIIDARPDVKVLILAKKHFLVLDSATVSIFTYSGRLHLTPKFPGLTAQLALLNEKILSLGLHYMAVRDCGDESLIHVFDLIPGASRQNDITTCHTKTTVQQIVVSRAGAINDQYMVFIDTNRDIFCTSLKNDSTFEIHKIGTQVISTMWASEANILVGLHDASYTIWYCPGEACMDPTVVALTKYTFHIPELGKNIVLENFEGNIVTLKSSGALYPIQVHLFCETLHKLLNDDLWVKALSLCRRIQDSILWATLAAISSKKNQLEIAEEAYSASLQIDKVKYLQHIKNLPPNSYEQMAETSVMMGRSNEAETILLHNNKVSEAIQLCVRMHRWERALDLAKLHKKEPDLEWILQQRKNLYPF
ncbi:intraflagellar transport protein 80 homolog isoform X2 [Contarinia nasturtii]|nr:intraflagellar transport protein 80 homolog isoform X2 [Contarinia nasturtii]